MNDTNAALFAALCITASVVNALWPEAGTINVIPARVDHTAVWSSHAKTRLLAPPSLRNALNPRENLFNRRAGYS